jgi:hypothetical protein
MSTPDPRARCEALVHRYQGGGEHDAREAEYADEPCGRLAKKTVRVGNRDVPACFVHYKGLAKLAALG